MNIKEPSGKRSTVVALSVAAISACLFVSILLMVPEDRDGGQILAFNFFFFFSAIILSGIFSFISLLIAISVFVRQKSLNNPLLFLAVLLSIPGLLFLSLMAVILIRNDEEDLADLYLPEPTYSNTEAVPLNKADSIYMTGFRWGGALEKKRVYISNQSYNSSTFNVNEMYHCQGDATFQLYYSPHEDSLLIYIPDKEPLYHFVPVRENLANIRVRAIQMTEAQMDSLSTNRDSTKVHVFSWSSSD